MAKRRPARGGTGKGKQGGGGGLAGLAVVAAVLGGGAYLYQHTKPTGIVAPRAAGLPALRPTERPDATAPRPAAVTPAAPSGAMPAKPLPAEAPSSEVPLEQVKPGVRMAPFGTSEEVFEAGARLYSANCASCHGRPGKNAKGPTAVQFWDRSNAAGRKAIMQPAGALYTETATGNLVAGMPSYGQRLTDTELWDLALLLRHAQDELPDPVLRLLHGGL